MPLDDQRHRVAVIIRHTRHDERVTADIVVSGHTRGGKFGLQCPTVHGGGKRKRQHQVPRNSAVK